MGPVIVAVGIGPGAPELLTEEAARALREAEVVIGYKPYVELVADLLPPEVRTEVSGMRQEVARCRRALQLHREGLRVAVVSSGDAGIYGMAGLLMELDPAAGLRVVPGITASQAAAARLGAPLMNDFLVLSLSDLLTPREEVLRRARAAAASGLVTCLYNPTSRRRRPLFEQVVEIFLGERSAETVVGWVRNAYREGEEVRLTTLGRLAEEPVDMWCTVLIGSSRTEILGRRMVTRRGYADKSPFQDEVLAAAEVQAGDAVREAPRVVVRPGPAAGPGRRLFVLGGTRFARGLVEDLERAGYEVRVSVATPLGAAEVDRPPAGGVQTGRLDRNALVAELQSWGAQALIDATHPFAVEATATAREAAAVASLPLLRATREPWRPESESPMVRYFRDAVELIAALRDAQARPFFTVGAKGLVAFARSGLPLAARVLPTPESVQGALAAGVQPRDLVAAYPPTTPSSRRPAFAACTATSS
ncbi:MAG: precorrin-3B C(17)-methyltransferase [Thermoleophilia bacterium]|nr:precorrin-3B C(17)-methyltransferase [Thermoleophilia bacterium]